MPSDHVPLYVRLSEQQSRRLQQAVSVSGKTKRQLVEDAVREHLSDEGLVVGRIARLEPDDRMPPSEEPGPEVLTLAEAAALLRVPEAALRAAAEHGDVPARWIGSRWRFSRAALLRWLEEPPPKG